MKKHNIVFILSIFSLFLCICGCKTTPQDTKVNPLELLDNKSQFYFRIPTSVDPVLVEKMLKSNVASLTDNDAKLIVSRLNTIYVGYTRRKKSAEYQISTECNFPKAAVSKVFSKKNGFHTESLSLKSNSGLTSYDIYSNNNLDISFPTQSIACLGRSIQDMITEYNRIENQYPQENFPSISAEMFEYLNYNSQEDDAKVVFWATNPYSFLTLLTGAQLNLALSYVRGSFICDPKLDKQYIMSFEFEFKDERVVRAAKSALMLAFGLADSTVTMTSPTNISISGIKISKEQIYKIFALSR